MHLELRSANHYLIQGDSSTDKSSLFANSMGLSLSSFPSSMNTRASNDGSSRDKFKNQNFYPSVSTPCPPRVQSVSRRVRNSNNTFKKNIQKWRQKCPYFPKVIFSLTKNNIHAMTIQKCLNTLILPHLHQILHNENTSVSKGLYCNIFKLTYNICETFFVTIPICPPSIGIYTGIQKNHFSPKSREQIFKHICVASKASKMTTITIPVVILHKVRTSYEI